MFTRCPQCNTTFRVSAEDLRVAGGDVRCGECESIFSALEYLSTAPETVAADTDTITFEQAVEAAIVEAGDEVVEAAPEPGPAKIEPQPEPGIETFRPVSERADNEIYFSTTLVDFEPAESEVSAESAPEPITPEDIELPAPEPAIAAYVGDPDELFGGRRAGSPRHTLWILASLIFALALGAQFVHIFREQLAQDPRFGPMVARLYERVGKPVISPADPGDYRIVKRGAFTNLDDRRSLRIRATIGNRSDKARPYPLMRLRLTDRWGDLVGRRDFSAEEYLIDNEPGERNLAPKQRVRAEVTILDPGEDATNFELDVCVRTADGIVRCADDSSEM